MDDETTAPEVSLDDSMKRRLSKLTTQKRSALDRVAELEEHLAEMSKRAELGQALTSRVSELEARLTSQASEHGRRIALVDAGVNDGDARDFLLHRYDRAGEEAGEFSEWLTSQRESASGFLAEVFQRSSPTPAQEPAETAETPTETAPPPASNGTPVNLDRGVGKQPTGPSGLSAEAILDSSRPWSEIKAALGQSYGWGVDGKGPK